jgi:hypothetical protein
MNIGPVSNRPPEISVTLPVSPAYERVKLMLFQPFDLARWFTIGFCAWLAGFAEAGGGGGGFNSNPNFHNGQSDHPQEVVRQYYHQALDYWTANFFWIIPVAIAVVLVGIVLWVVFLWLGSRGKFMFLHCVALNRAEVVVPWEKYASLAHSLFWFRIVFALASMVVVLPLVIVGAIFTIAMMQHNDIAVFGVLLLIGLVLAVIVLVIILGVIRRFLDDFVIPIMYLRNSNCMAAWGEFFKLLKTHPGQFTLYILFRLLLAIAIAGALVTVILVTCCIAGCLMAIPYIGTVVLLPVLIFSQSYALYFLAQFGPEYDAFPKLPTPTPPPPVGGLNPVVPTSSSTPS